VRTGYSAIADEWVPIKPGTDGALFLAMIHEIIKLGLFDREFLIQYTNAAELVIDDPSATTTACSIATRRRVEEGCTDPQNKLWWDRNTNGPVDPHRGRRPAPDGQLHHEGTPVKPSFQLLKERVEPYTPEWAEGITGIPAETIRRLAHEMGVTARDQKIELPIQWTDCGTRSTTRSPATRSPSTPCAAWPHSNGFQTIRALSILMTVLGTIDRPGGFRHKAPFPRPIPPCPKPPNGPEAVQPNTPLDGMPLGWPADPNDLFVDDDGEPVRIDKAFSWEYPLSVHGLMHNVITNAWRGDPYPSTRCSCSWPTWPGTRR
jgi:anaerobic selenocysteine-containing dehydrogenase